MVKNQNKLDAEKRRDLLKKNLQKISGITTISCRQIKAKYDFDFPSSLAASLNDSEINIAICASDKISTKSCYELDTWAFALYYKMQTKANTINFYVQIPNVPFALENQKWYDLFIKRISFLVEYKKVITNFTLQTFDVNGENHNIITIPEWKSVIQEIDLKNIYTPLDLSTRNSKTTRDNEDKEQERIIDELKKDQKNLFIQKEFTFVYQKHRRINNSFRNRIDVLYADNLNITIIELKVKKDLDVVAQILDYYIFVLTHISYFRNAGWEFIAPGKAIRSIILCTVKHPILENVTNTYKLFGFPNLEFGESNNGNYPISF